MGNKERTVVTLLYHAGQSKKIDSIDNYTLQERHLAGQSANRMRPEERTVFCLTLRGLTLLSLLSISGPECHAMWVTCPN